MNEQLRARASTRLKRLGERLAAEDRPVAVGEVVDSFGPAGIGLLLLFLTLPALVPLPGPWGMTFGTILSLVALQVMAGARKVWVPATIRRRSVSADLVARLAAASHPTLAAAERWLQPRRLLPLTGRQARMLVAVPIFINAVIIALPIPMGNLVPAFATIAISLGICVRDGAAVLVGLLLSVAALIWTGALLMFGAAIIDWAMGFFA